MLLPQIPDIDLKSALTEYFESPSSLEVVGLNKFNVLSPSKSVVQQQDALRDASALRAFLESYFSQPITFSDVGILVADSTDDDEQADESSRSPALIAALIASLAIICCFFAVLFVIIPRYKTRKRKKQQWMYSQEKESRVQQSVMDADAIEDEKQTIP